MIKRKRISLVVAYFDVQVHRGVAEYARRHHWILDAHPHHPTRRPEVCEGDGVLFLNERLDVPDVIRVFPNPAVNLGRSHEPERYPEVRTDAKAIGSLAAEHLMRCGLTRFACVVSDESPYLRGRGEAFAAHVHEAGLEHVPIPAFTENWEESMREWLRATPKPLGLLAKNDAEAQLILQFCLDLEIAVPGDVALIGVGNEPLIVELSAVSLSSVDSNAFGKGYKAASLLDRWISTGERPPPVTVVPAKGVVARDSTGVLHADRPELRDAFEIIQSNFQQPLRLDDIAARAGLSRRRLQDLIKTRTGKPFKTLLLEKRLAEAERLLRLGQLKLQAVAFECGFKSDAHLCQVFRRERGLTPGEYRDHAKGP